MKKLPMVFCLLFSACSSQKQAILITSDFATHQQPYHVFSVGRWDASHLVLTLKDANNLYFVIKANASALVKAGDIYKPTSL